MGSLTSIQKDILVGSLLGDGTLRRQGTRTNALFEVNHSFQYREYVDWKYDNLQIYVKTPPKSRKGNGKRIAYRFTTRSLPIFTEYYHRYYSNCKKIIEPDLHLSDLILSVWFMDDGSKSRNTFYLNSQQFSLEDQLLLMNCLKRDMRIESSLNKDKQYKRIRVRTESADRFRKIVNTYLLPCFKYKLIMTP